MTKAEFVEKIDMLDQLLVDKIDTLDQLLNDPNVRLEPAKIWHLLAEIADRAPSGGAGLPQPSAVNRADREATGREATSIPCGLCGGKGIFRGIKCPACQTRVVADPWDDSRGVDHSRSDLPLRGFRDIEPALPAPATLDFARMDGVSPAGPEA